MVNSLKCPFCGAKLVQVNTTVKKIWHCPNIDCKGHNYFGVDDFWNTIISGKKAQDALKVATDFIGFVNTSRHADGALAAMAICKLNEITSIIKRGE